MPWWQEQLRRTLLTAFCDKNATKLQSLVLCYRKLVKEGSSRLDNRSISLTESDYDPSNKSRQLCLHRSDVSRLRKRLNIGSPSAIVSLSIDSDILSLNTCHRILWIDGNVEPSLAGSFLRSFVAFGFDGLIVSHDTSFLFSKKFNDVSRGVLLKVPHARMTGSEIDHFLSSNEFHSLCWTDSRTILSNEKRVIKVLASSYGEVFSSVPRSIMASIRAFSV